ncbi:SDR family NAD(P)-dependent oxidoreductase [Streptomyces sp. 21So2-11]|uniref:SDR family NAD(P)-dependent oxidoreductase n=1 Tax=Streptomyces sp. 21So2-11 TaxID=3144408 RepID=UPI00321A6DF6
MTRPCRASSRTRPGCVALVTGAGQGSGEAVVRALPARGATVAATDRKPEGVTALAESVEKDRAAGHL